jgi:hypothetical protein
VILGHFGLAIGGLVVWIGYLLTDAPALAWLAVGFLLPVAGLGIATLVQSIPETAAANAHQAAGGAGRAASRATPIAGPVPARTPMPVVVISVHGLLATATLLLVLLAAIAAH